MWHKVANKLLGNVHAQYCMPSLQPVLHAWFTSSSRVFSFLCILVFASACTMSERVEYSDIEGRIPERFFETINIYAVSEAWLASQLGQASFIQDGPRQQKIHTYKVTRKKIEQVNYMWLIRSSETLQQAEYLHFVFIDDKLVSHWGDSTPQVSFNEPPVNTTFIRDEIQLVAPKNQAVKSSSQSAMNNNMNTGGNSSASETKAMAQTTSADDSVRYKPQQQNEVVEIDLMQADGSKVQPPQERVTPNKGVQGSEKPPVNTPPPKEFNFPPTR